MMQNRYGSISKAFYVIVYSSVFQRLNVLIHEKSSLGIDQYMINTVQK